MSVTHRVVKLTTTRQLVSHWNHTQPPPPKLWKIAFLDLSKLVKCFLLYWLSIVVGYPQIFLIILCIHQNELKIINDQKLKEMYLIVPADFLILDDAKTSAGTAVMKFRTYIDMEQALAGLTFVLLSFLSIINSFLFSSLKWNVWHMTWEKNTTPACPNCSRRPQAQVSGGDTTRNLCLWPPGAGCVTPECPSRPVTLSLVSVTCLCHQLARDSWANRHLECHPLLQYLEMILPTTWLILMVYGSFVYGIIFVVYCTVWSCYWWPIFCKIFQIDTPSPRGGFISRVSVSTTHVLVLHKMINMNILKTFYLITTQVPIFQY